MITITKLIVAITGASGAIYGIRLLEELKKAGGIETHLLISDWAEETIKLETDYSVEAVRSLADVVYHNRDQAAKIASGSFLNAGMVIVPCSMKTLAAIAHGYGDSLITRAAYVCLKERRRLLLVPRETPLSTIHLENLLRLSKLGAVVIPPIPAFYHRPQTLAEVVDQTVGQILDHLSVPHNLLPRWQAED